MLFGAHVSVAGGLHRAFDGVKEYGCECFQIFTKSQLRWEAKPIGTTEIKEWQRAWQAHRGLPCLIHGAYLINLASPNEELRHRSVEAMVDEIRRAHALGIPYVNTHPGSHAGVEETEGLDICARSLREVLRRTARSGVSILLETTAGQGNDLGARFEQLGYLIDALGGSERLGVCIDTCHIFAAGYDFRTPKTYSAMWKDFDRLVGIHRVKAFHLNDSKFPLASHRDRHEEIGKGHIGEAGFRLLVRDPRFQHLPAVTELKEVLTPRSLQTLKRLRSGKA